MPAGRPFFHLPGLPGKILLAAFMPVLVLEEGWTIWRETRNWRTARRCIREDWRHLAKILRQE